jgi:hypothetical protein
VDPPGEGHNLSHMRRAQFVAMMRSFHSDLSQNPKRTRMLPGEEPHFKAKIQERVGQCASRYRRQPPNSPIGRSASRPGSQDRELRSRRRIGGLPLRCTAAASRDGSHSGGSSEMRSAGTVLASPIRTQRIAAVPGCEFLHRLGAQTSHARK